MRPFFSLKKSYNNLKNHDKGSLLAGSLVFLPAVVFTIFAIYRIISPINDYVSSGMPWDTSFNSMMVQILVNLPLLLPAIIMFVVAYLQAESNTIGFKVSFALSIGFLCALILNWGNANLLLFCMISNIMATLVGFEETRKNRTKKYAPIVVEKVAILFLRLSGFITIAILVGIISYVAIRGVQFLSLEFLTSDYINYTQMAKQIAASEPITGGIKSFILGSLIIAGYCEAIAIPLGLGAAIYLAEYAPKGKIVETIRFFIETLAGAPSIIIGLFGFTYFVNMAGMGQSTAAAGFSLAFMILPWNIRVAEEAMRAVPQAYREAAYALGATKWQAIRKTVLLPASPGAITGVLLGLGGAIGETAVLMFTAGSIGVDVLPNQISIIGGSGQQMPVLATWILAAYKYVRVNGADVTASTVWQWGNVVYTGALVLLIIFFIISVGALVLRNYLAKKTKGA
jgi:phosphate transport system permease protein